VHRVQKKWPQKKRLRAKKGYGPPPPPTPSRAGQELTKPNHRTLQRLVLKHQKNSLYVVLLHVKLNGDLSNFRCCSDSTLNRFK